MHWWEQMCNGWPVAKLRDKRKGTWPTGNGLMSKVSAQTTPSIYHGQKWPTQVSFLVYGSSGFHHDTTMSSLYSIACDHLCTHWQDSLKKCETRPFIFQLSYPALVCFDHLNHSLDEHCAVSWCRHNMMPETGKFLWNKLNFIESELCTWHFWMFAKHSDGQ